MHEPARQRARDLANTPAFASAQRQRKKVEAMFAELKNLIGLRRLRLRRMKFVREQFFLAAAAQNVKRLVRFLSQPITPIGGHHLTEVSEEEWRVPTQRDSLNAVFQHPQAITPTTAPRPAGPSGCRRNGDFSPTDRQILVGCHRIAMDRQSLVSKLLLGVAALVVAVLLFWLAGGVRWLDTKAFPPRRPQDMPQNAVWIDAPPLPISWHHGWWFGCDLAPSGTANYCRLVMANGKEVYAGEYLPCKSEDSTSGLHQGVGSSTSQCRDVDCGQAFGHAGSGWSLEEW